MRQEALQRLGPLKKFAGVWSGAGVDWAPGKDYQPLEHDIPIEEHLKLLEALPYWQEMQLEPMPLLTYSAADQTVTGLRYLGKIWGSKDSVVTGENYPDFFPVYEENGYILWIPNKDDPSIGTIVRQISNPRGLSFMARAENISVDATEFKAACSVSEDPFYGILQTPHLRSIYYPSPLFESLWCYSYQDNNDTIYYDEYTFLTHPNSEFLIPQRDEAVLKKYTP